MEPLKPARRRKRKSQDERGGEREVMEKKPRNSTEEDVEALGDYYVKQGRKGLVMSRKELREWAEKRGVYFTVKELDEVKNRLKFMAKHARYRRPAHFMTKAIEKPGQLEADAMMFRRNYKRQNSNCEYILLVVDRSTQVTGAVGMTSKSQESWVKALHYIVKKWFPDANSCTSDRDTAISGAQVKEELKRSLGLTWHHMPLRVKASHAERAIRWVRQRLEMALEGSNTNNWTRFLPGILRQHNSGMITGTNTVRSSVTKESFFKMLQEKLKTPNPNVLFNVSTTNSFTDKLASQLFKFPLQSRVLLARPVNAYAEKKVTKFSKMSEGAYGDEVYTVVAHSLRSTGDYFVTPTYKLSGHGMPENNKWYESELTLVKIAGDPVAEDESRKRKEKAAAARAKKRRLNKN